MDRRNEERETEILEEAMLTGDCFRELRERM